MDQPMTNVDAEEAARQAVINEIENTLRRPDYVLETNCFPTLVDYIKAQGRPQTAMELLSDGYTGYAQMASLMCRWMDLVKDPNELPNASSGPSTQQQQQQPQALDEFYFLKEVVKSRFATDKLADVFSAGGGKPPAWLEGLTCETRGRQLVYELSADHRNCLLLNYAIQKILLQGHEDEVAVVGSSLAGYFTVFHRLLAARLRAVVSACSEAEGEGGSAAAGDQHHAERIAAGAAAGPGPGSSGGGRSRGSGGAGDAGTHGTGAAALKAITRELVDSCAHSQHTYLHAQQLLCELSSHPRGHVFLRLSQELEAAVAAGHPEVWAMRRMLVPASAHPATIEAAALVSKLLAAAQHSSSGSSGSTSVPNAMDILALAKLFGWVPGRGGSGGGAASSGGGYGGYGEDCPSLATIQHPQLIQLLISTVFSPGKPPAADLQAQCVFLLARATSGWDAGEGEAEEDEASQSARVEATRRALLEALSVGQKAQGKMGPEDGPAADRVAQMPIAAMGLLHYMRGHLAQREYYYEASAMSAAPVFLRLALLIARRQPGMVPQVCSLIETALEAVGSQRAELSKQLLDGLVVLMRDCAAVSEVMALVDTWAQGADPSLIRYLFMQIISTLAPPYSPAFVRWMLHHMMRSGLRRARDRSQEGLLRELPAACMASGAELGPKETAFLQELAGAAGRG